jgi:hypothetical protein
MAIDPFTFRVARGHLDTFDGGELGWLILDPDGASAAAPSMATVEDLTGELDVGDAPGYERGTIAVVWDAELGMLKRDPGAAVPATDTSGATPRAVVFFDPGATDADSELVSLLPVPEGAGYADWDIDPSNGIAVADDEADLVLDDLSDVDTSTAAPTDGQGLVWDAGLERWGPGDVAGGGASDDSDLTITAGSALLFRTADTAAFYEAVADSLAVPTAVKEQAAVVLPYVVTDDGTDQEQINDNASRFGAYALTQAQIARHAARMAQAFDDPSALGGEPAAYTSVGYGEEGYGTSPRGHWSCSTTIDSPASSLRLRSWRRIVVSPSSDNPNQYQEDWSEEINDGTDGADRIEGAIATDSGEPRTFVEKTPDGSVIEDIQSTGGTVPAGKWFEWMVDYDLTGATVSHRVRCDIGWDYEDPDDGSRWITTLVEDVSAADPSIAASDAAEQWIGRGSGHFDIARIRVWVDDVPAVDANFTTAADGATTIDDAVLEASPGTPAEWVAQENAEVSEASAPSGGAVDSVNGATGTVVLDAADVSAVPTSRTLAGIDLTADRTAAELRAAIGNGEWAKPVLHAFVSWKDASHAPSRLFSNARWFAATMQADSTSLNRWVEWYAGHFDAGTWKQLSFGERGAALGTCTFELTPLAGGSTITVGTAARYNPTTEAAPDPVEHTGIVIPTSGQYVLRSTVTAGGNGVSTNAGQRWSVFQFVRTA